MKKVFIVLRKYKKMEWEIIATFDSKEKANQEIKQTINSTGNLTFKIVEKEVF